MQLPGTQDGRANVSSRLIAKRVTAVISVMADTGNHDQAQTAKPWYARISAPIRSTHPALSNRSEANMSLVLSRRRIPENAGSILCPTQNTIVARNPTVKA
jgi:hypothetical protein